ncbi:phosphopantothenoylcysteine decarboxylase [Brevibacillus sp. NPDC058079]|uniref:phosphopantothenoylcysteine decarboxylase domain-containing protein n=1 Tax=Brevibacillus sp. NPDC058079 TaxID=3346330 RepID=UPI0036E5687D
MNIVITAGGTSEAIDKVRKITNMSKGTLGREIASVAEFHPHIKKIYFLSPFSKQAEAEWIGLTGKFAKIEWIETTSVKSVYDSLQEILTTKKIDIVIHAMAVSDYTVDYVYTLEDMVEGIYNYIKQNDQESVEGLLEKGYMTPKGVSLEDVISWAKKGDYRLDNSSKISSKSDNLCIQLTPTEKIISQIKIWSPETTLVGFKLLENVTKEELIQVATQLKIKNKADYVFANDIRLIRESGHQGYLVMPDGEAVELVGIKEIANAIVNHTVGDRRV